MKRQMQGFGWLLAVGLLMSTAALSGCGGQDAKAHAAAKVGARPGVAAPDFSLQDFEGKTHRLSEFRGKPVLLNFWASWCGPCQMEMPDLAHAADRWQGKVQFLGVNLTQQDAKDVAAKFLQESHVKYPNLQDVKGEAADKFQILVIPTTFVLDGEGKIAVRIQGPLKESDIDKLLEKISRQ